MSGTTSAKTLPKIDTQTPLCDAAPSALSLCVQYRRCGKPGCRCAAGGDELHGPYYCLFYRENGRLRKRYVRKDEVEEVRAAVEALRSVRRAEREREEGHKQIWRSMKQNLRRIEEQTKPGRAAASETAQES